MRAERHFIIIVGDSGRTQFFLQNQPFILANHPERAIDNKAEYPRLANPASLVELTATRSRHQSAARMFRHTLALDRADAWVEFGMVAAVRLVEHERAMAAYSLLRTLDPDLREQIMQAAHWGSH